jgi:hypothetical protein
MNRPAYFGLALLVLTSCSHGGARTVSAVTVRGRVTDTSGRPVAGAAIQVGPKSGTSGTDGSYVMAGVTPGSTIAVSDCAYQAATVPVPAAGSVVVQLSPLPIQGRVLSNLTHAGISGRVTGKQVASTARGGSFTLLGNCPGDTLTISASGYSTASVQVPASRTLTASLRADPATTFTQDIAWEAAQQWSRECALLHPDNHAYVSNAQCSAELAKSAAQGYQSVSVKVHSVTYVTWTFARCSLANFGPKTYHHVAAVNYTLQQSTPNGGVSPTSGILHMVQTKDGVWRWFVTTGCTTPLP